MLLDRGRGALGHYLVEGGPCAFESFQDYHLIGNTFTGGAAGGASEAMTQVDRGGLRSIIDEVTCCSKGTEELLQVTIDALTTSGERSSRPSWGPKGVVDR